MIKLIAWILNTEADDREDHANHIGELFEELMGDFKATDYLDLFPIVQLEFEDEPSNVTYYCIYSDFTNDEYTHYILGYKNGIYEDCFWASNSEISNWFPAKKILEFTIKDNHEL